MWGSKNEIDLYISFLKEREQVRLKREDNQSPPWTMDEVLRTYKFTNIFRIHDRVTRHYMRHISPLISKTGYSCYRNIVFNTLAYRIINWPFTMNCVGLLDYNKLSRSRKHFEKVFKLRKEAGLKLYTGAYMITASPEEDLEKHHSTFESLTKFAATIKSGGLEALPEELTQEGYFRSLTNFIADSTPRVGKFIAYEVVTDLSYTVLSKNVGDIYGWANAGPGAVRGINRLRGLPVKSPMTEEASLRDMGRLRWHLVKHLPKLPPGGEGAWTMRDVEHSLCEFDKYRRVQLDEGRPRSKYPGTTAEDWWAWNKKENELFDKEEAFYRKHFFKKG